MVDDQLTPLTNRVAEVLSGMPDAVQATVEAQMALSAAGEIDAGRQLSIAPVMKELRTLMDWLRAQASAQAAEVDPLDALAERRARRANTAN